MSRREPPSALPESRAGTAAALAPFPKKRPRTALGLGIQPSFQFPFSLSRGRCISLPQPPSLCRYGSSLERKFIVQNQRMKQDFEQAGRGLGIAGVGGGTGCPLGCPFWAAGRSE